MIDSNALRDGYRRFLAPGRILLTGHSHQAWPDAARDGVTAAFDAAAAHVDDKWDEAFRVAGEVRTYVAGMLGTAAADVALDLNTHALVTRFLSALPWRKRRRLVTTAGEFHTVYRQLRRLGEEGVEVVFVDPDPVPTLAARLAAAATDGTAAVLCSSVLFETSSIVPHLDGLAAHCRAADVPLLIDAYHQFGVVPFDANRFVADAFVVGGGYKYAQWGEGVCFMAVPSGSTLRPVLTGWFADFAHLADRQERGPVAYGDGGAARFAGATYDPTSHYRARAVIGFFRDRGLTMPALRQCSLRQTGRILDHADRLGLTVATPRNETGRGGFVSIVAPDAAALVGRLRARGVWTDSRGRLLRVGPAPYTTDAEIDTAMDALGSLCTANASSEP